MANVILLNNCYPSKSFPNKSTYIQSIEACLVEAGINVKKLVLYSTHASSMQKILNYLTFYKKLFFFKRFGEFDYTYIHHFPFVFIPLVFQFPRLKNVIINWHGEDLQPSTPINNLLSFISYKFIKPSFSHIVPSCYYREILSQKLNIAMEKIIVSPSGGVDTRLFRPSQKSKNDKVVNLGFASGLIKGKGVKYLLYALKNQEKLPKKVLFHIINYGYEKEKYLTEISKYENVIMHNVYTKEKMPDFYNSIDILLFPTKKESLGLVALESMSCDVPVIGPNHFALKTIIIKGLNGESYERFELCEFLDAIIKCVNNLDRYCPRETIKDLYSRDSVIEQFKHIFT